MPQLKIVLATFVSSSLILSSMPLGGFTDESGVDGGGGGGGIGDCRDDDDDDDDDDERSSTHMDESSLDD